MKALINDIWFLERNIVSEGFDLALARVSRDLPLNVHEYASGAQVWSWVVPDKWSCSEAYVERMNGERLLDYADHPLHCASYSSSFEGIVSRAELFDHLNVHARFPDAIPFAWKYHQDDWALSCSAETKRRMVDEEYKVVVRTNRAPGKLKVGEFLVEGETDQEFILCAHLCHPCMANDDASGVAVAVEVMRRLAAMPSLKYTYRLLLTPETIGSVAWLSSHEEMVHKIVGGLFLEMLGTDCPHALQMSFRGDTAIDALLWGAIQEREPDAWNGPYRRVIGNDERQFNAPGVRVPMLSLSRVFHPDTGKWPYPEYHSSKDTADFISYERLDDSVETVLQLIGRLEATRFPVNLYKGELCASRYGLFIDFYRDPEGNRRLFDIIQMIDGTKSPEQLAAAADAPLMDVNDLLRRLEELGLVYFSAFPVRDRSAIARPAITNRVVDET